MLIEPNLEWKKTSSYFRHFQRFPWLQVQGWRWGLLRAALNQKRNLAKLLFEFAQVRCLCDMEWYMGLEDMLCSLYVLHFKRTDVVWQMASTADSQGLGIGVFLLKKREILEKGYTILKSLLNHATSSPSTGSSDRTYRECTYRSMQGYTDFCTSPSVPGKGWSCGMRGSIERHLLTTFRRHTTSDGGMRPWCRPRQPTTCLRSIQWTMQKECGLLISVRWRKSALYRCCLFVTLLSRKCILSCHKWTVPSTWSIEVKLSFKLGILDLQYLEHKKPWILAIVTTVERPALYLFLASPTSLSLLRLQSKSQKIPCFKRRSYFQVLDLSHFHI